MRIGELVPNRSRKNVRFRYTDEALDTYETGMPLLSSSLPVRSGVHDANGFFAGLLPEGHHLRAIADKAGVPPHDIHGILSRFGRDVVGAVIITPTTDQSVPDNASIEQLSNTALNDVVSSLTERSLGLDAPGFGSPLSGFQDKIALVAMGKDVYALPVAGHPSTHILKREDPRLAGGAAAEAECLRLAKRIGLTTVTGVVRSHGGYRCLIVDRFDREKTAAGVRRIHQEDACQALGLDPGPTEGGIKYEQHGGPSFADVAGLLTHYSANPDGELAQLARAATYTVAIGNADAHGKNVAFLHSAAGTISLAPLYDTLPTVLWPDAIHDRMSMTINNKVGINDVKVTDLVAEVTRWGLNPKTAESEIRQTLDALRFHAAGKSNVATLVRGRVDDIDPRPTTKSPKADRTPRSRTTRARST